MLWNVRNTHYPRLPVTKKVCKLYKINLKLFMKPTIYMLNQNAKYGPRKALVF